MRKKCSICQAWLINDAQKIAGHCGSSYCAHEVKLAERWAKQACDRIFSHYQNPKKPYANRGAA